MISVSNDYKELVKSNIRPKCEPIIKVSGVNETTGEEINIVWNASDIKNLKYKRSVDPVGRELPYMELTWTELYTGNLNEDAYPEKYANISTNLKVELSFKQDLEFGSKWGKVLDEYSTWQELLDSKLTWGEVKSKVSQEIISFPSMFISERPIINGRTVEWKARDLINFLNFEHLNGYGYESEPNIGLDLLSIVRDELAYAEKSYTNNSQIREAILKTLDYLEDLIYNSSSFQFLLDKKIIVKGTTKDILKNLIAIPSWCWDFMPDGSLALRDNSLNEYDYRGMDISANVLYSYPKVAKVNNISSYDFSYSSIKQNTDKNYKIYDSQKIDEVDEALGQTLTYYLWLFEGLGIVKTYYNVDVTDIFNDFTYAITYNDYENLVVTPISTTEQKESIGLGIKGDIFKENNPINPYDSRSDVIKKRKNFLAGYFNEKNSNIEFDMLSNLALEPLDGLFVDTNLYNSNGEQIKKPGIIVGLELSYNGALKEKIKMHGTPDIFVG